MTDFPAATWRKSSHSGDHGGECVEVAGLSETTVGIRDSKRSDGPVLVVGPVAFRSFLIQIKSGLLDR